MDLLIAGLPVSGVIVAPVESAQRLGLACGVLAHLGVMAPSVH